MTPTGGFKLSKASSFLLVFGLVAAMALAALLLTGHVSADRPIDPINEVAIDVDGTGNSGHALGTTQACNSQPLSVNDELTTDIVARGIPPVEKSGWLTSGGIQGYDMDLLYNTHVLQIESVNFDNPSIFETGGLTDGVVPNTTGSLHLGRAQFSRTTTGGDGVLARLQAKVVGTGRSTLQLTYALVGAETPFIYDGTLATDNIRSLKMGQVAVGVPCLADPLPRVAGLETSSVSATADSTVDVEVWLDVGELDISSVSVQSDRADYIGCQAEPGFVCGGSGPYFQFNGGALPHGRTKVGELEVRAPHYASHTILSAFAFLTDSDGRRLTASLHAGTLTVSQPPSPTPATTPVPSPFSTPRPFHLEVSDATIALGSQKTIDVWAVTPTAGSWTYFFTINWDPEILDAASCEVASTGNTDCNYRYRDDSVGFYGEMVAAGPGRWKVGSFSVRGQTPGVAQVGSHIEFFGCSNGCYASQMEVPHARITVSVNAPRPTRSPQGWTTNSNRHADYATDANAGAYGHRRAADS
jgi:hypothetical protein